MAMTPRKIITSYDPKPIPFRQFDWSAVFDDDESLTGYGRTEQDAINDLRTLEEERA